jgi:ectoine hydroxylase-related dioxygenase (phytanoyl-CoA dioxygenase family)
MNIPRFTKENISNAKKFYEEYGFCIISNIIPLDYINKFKSDVDSICLSYAKKANLSNLNSRIDVSASELIMLLEGIDHDFVAAIYDSLYQIPSFFQIIGMNDIESTINTLLNKDNKTNPLYGYTNRCRIDPPKDQRRTYGWHQEIFYTIPESDFIQTWAPLYFDTTLENGTIEVAVGSHRENIAPQSWNEEMGKATQIIIPEHIISKYPCSPIPMKLGELLFFSGHLAHRSGSNTSSQVRFSLVGMYHDIDRTEFMAPRCDFKYRKLDPKTYYDRLTKK